MLSLLMTTEYAPAVNSSEYSVVLSKMSVVYSADAQTVMDENAIEVAAKIANSDFALFICTSLSLTNPKFNKP